MHSGGAAVDRAVKEGLLREVTSQVILDAGEVLLHGDPGKRV